MEKVIAVNLKRLRARKDVTQEKAAELADISRVAYRNLETGKTEPRVSTLMSLAKAFGVKIEEIVTPVKQLKAVRFRAHKKMFGRDDILADVSLWLEDFNFLEKELDADMSGKNRSMFEVMNAVPKGAGRPKRAAQTVRGHFKLKNDEPVWDVCGLLESHGIKVYPRSAASDAWFGLSVADHAGSPAVVVNVWDKISVERWIFSAAHELGHLLLHMNSFDPDKNDENPVEEKEANIFASHFLLPEEGFKKEWDDASGLPFVRRVMKVKRIFRVSYRTILYRLVESKVADKSIWPRFYAEYSREYKTALSAKVEPDPISWEAFSALLRTAEPGNLTADDFQEDRLSRLVRQAIESEKISMARGAEILRLDLLEMRKLASSWMA